MATPTKKKRPSLTAKQQAFVNHYLICLNATEAARLAGYAHPNQQGPRLLVNVGIRAAVDARFKELHLTADEAIARLATHARGDMGDCLDIDEHGWKLDLKKMKELGLTRLIKKISYNEYGPVIELYDVQTAIAQILKYIQPNAEINVNVNINDARERLAQRLNSLSTRSDAPPADRVTH